MTNLRLLVVLGVLGLAGELVCCAPISPVTPLQRNAPPWGSGTFEFAFEANKRACAIVIGRGPPNVQTPVAHTILGLYVYDAHGNCVARDDLVHPKVRDDLAVEWYPPVESRHTIEVVNFGGEINRFELAVK